MRKTYTNALVFDKKDLGVDPVVRYSLHIHYKRNLFIDKIEYNPPSTIIHDNEDACLQQADELGFDFAILTWEGNIFDIHTYHDACIELINKLDADTNGNWLVAGHIMDQHANRTLYKDPAADNWRDSFWLFPITALVNVKKWAELGCPAWGQQSDGLQSVVKIKPSQETVHDNYTPLVIEPDNSQVTVNVKKGWRIVNESMKAGWPVYNLNDRIRGYQNYLYPEVNINRYNKFWLSVYSMPKLTDQYKRALDLQVLHSKNPKRIKATTWQCFIRNTERYFANPNIQSTDYSDIDTFILPCSGFKDFIVTMGTMAPRKITSIVHFDIIPECVEIKQKIINRWDGTRQHFTTTLNEIALEYKENYRLVYHMHEMKELVEAYDHMLLHFDSEEDLRQQWLKFKTCSHYYITADILEEPHLVLRFIQGKKVFICLSDIPGWRNNIIGYGYRNLRNDIINCLQPMMKKGVGGVIDYKDPATDLQHWQSFEDAVVYLNKDAELISHY